MAEETKTPTTAPKAESKVAAAGAPEAAPTETLREAPGTPPPSGVRDGRGVDLLPTIDNPDYDPADPSKGPEQIPDPETGTLVSGVTRATFQQSHTKIVTGTDGKEHTVLTDHLKGTEKLSDVQSDAGDSESAKSSQWIW